MLMNKALTAFRATDPGYTVDRSIVNSEKWIVKNPKGERVTSALGHTKQEAWAIRNDAILREKLVAAMQEIISVKTLTLAMMLAGAPDAGARALAANMLPKLIDIIGQREDDDVTVN